MKANELCRKVETDCKELPVGLSKEESGTIFRTIITLSRMMREGRNKDMEEIGLTCRQADLLFFLLSRRDQEINQVMIEQEFHLSNPTVTGVLNRLEQKGFIQRIPSQHDKRCKYIRLTEKADLLDEEIQNKRRSMEMRAMRGIGEEEIRTMQDILNRMFQNMLDIQEEWNKE